jgi:hypothetical protein
MARNNVTDANPDGLGQRTHQRSPSAARGRRFRANRRAGLRYRGGWFDDRALKAALRRAGRLTEGATEAEISAATSQIVKDFIERWKKLRTRYALPDR